MSKGLDEGHKEQVIFQGIINENRVAELWIDRRDESWTILHRAAGGRACFVMSGKGYVMLMTEPDDDL